MQSSNYYYGFIYLSNSYYRRANTAPPPPNFTSNPPFYLRPLLHTIKGCRNGAIPWRSHSAHLSAKILVYLGGGVRWAKNRIKYVSRSPCPFFFAAQSWYRWQRYSYIWAKIKSIFGCSTVDECVCVLVCVSKAAREVRKGKCRRNWSFLVWQNSVRNEGEMETVFAVWGTRVTEIPIKFAKEQIE